MTQQPQVKVGVGVFVVHAPTRTFLLGHRQNSLGHDTWALPGGHLEVGETFEDCAAREVGEETGIDVVAAAASAAAGGLKYWTAVNSVMMGVEGKRHHYVTIFMVVSVQGKDGDRLQAEVLEPERCKGWDWVSWEELRGWAGAEDTDRASGTRGGGGRRLFQPMRDLLVQRDGLVPPGL